MMIKKYSIVRVHEMRRMAICLSRQKRRPRAVVSQANYVSGTDELLRPYDVSAKVSTKSGAVTLASVYYFVNESKDCN